MTAHVTARRKAHSARRYYTVAARNRQWCRREARREARAYAKARRVHRSAAWWRRYYSPAAVAKRRRAEAKAVRDIRKYLREEKRAVLASGKKWINYPACPSQVKSKIYHTAAARKRQEERKKKRIECRRALRRIKAYDASKAAKSKKASKAVKASKAKSGRSSC